MRGRLQTAECRLLSNAVNSVEVGDFRAPSRRRSLTLRVFAMVSYVVGCVEAGDFGAPLPTLEMTGGGAFRMKMTKRSVNGKILFPKLWKMKSFGNRIFT